jgi:glycosyltransferase involved in cell wall biosynthesis
MKILLLFSHSWRGGRSGGAETHALQLMDGLSRRGHEVFFVASGDKSELGALPPGVKAEYRLPFQSLNPLDKLSVYRQLAEIVRRHGIEIVHAHHRTGGYYAEALCRRCGVPYVLTVHDIWHRAPMKSMHGRIFRNLIAVSGFIKRGLVERFGIPEGRIQVIHNGVDPELIERASDAAAAAFRRVFEIGDEVVFSLIARVTRSKGHYDFVEALRRLPRALNCRFLIVGEGDDREKLEELVLYYGLQDRVVFCGFQGNIPAVMRASDVIVLPSHREPFAITVLEAMFSRRPLLVSNSGGTPEAVTNDREGIVFPTRDVEALARGIELLSGDEALRRRLGEQAYRTAHSRFLLADMISATEKRYMEIAALQRSQTRLL